MPPGFPRGGAGLASRLARPACFADQPPAARGELGSPHAEDEGLQLLGRAALGQLVAVRLCEPPRSAKRGELLGFAFLVLIVPEPEDALAERLARLLRERVNAANGKLEPHRDDGPPAPQRAVFRSKGEKRLGALGDGGHTKLRRVPKCFIQEYSILDGASVNLV